MISASKKLFEKLGKRRAVLVNEITKMYEKTFNFNLGDDLSNFVPKGEYVLVVEGMQNDTDDLSEMSIEEHLKYYLNLGENKNDAIIWVCCTLSWSYLYLKTGESSART